MNKAEILIIDDEPQIRKLLQIALESQDYVVRLASTGKEGLIMATSYQPELILLDLGLPDISGHQVLQQLREWYNKRIIILSVIDTEDDIVSALDEGANDYLTKPFRTRELLARIRAAIKNDAVDNNRTVLTFNDLEIDLIGRVVKKDGTIIKLTATEYDLLKIFAQNSDRVLTHQYILKQIWGVGAQTETQYLRVFIGTLRKKIEKDPTHPLHIFTENRIGYRFT